MKLLTDLVDTNNYSAEERYIEDEYFDSSSESDVERENQGPDDKEPGIREEFLESANALPPLRLYPTLHRCWTEVCRVCISRMSLTLRSMVTSLTSLLGQEVPNAATYHYNYMPMSPLSSDSETNSSEIETSDSESDTGIFPGSLVSANKTKNTAETGTVGHGSADGRLAERHPEPYDRDSKPCKDNGDDAGYSADVESREDSGAEDEEDRKSTRLNSSHSGESRMPSSA